MKQYISLFILPLLAACASPNVDGASAPQRGGGDACNASAYAGDVGQSMGTARFPANTEMRLINPGEMVTQEFVPTRLNVEVDRAGRIVAITCG